METLINFLNDNLSYQLLAIIIFGGVFLTNYTKGVLIFGYNIKDTYKVLFASIIVSIIFYFLDGCGKECLIRYFFTYLFATSFYELIVKWVFDNLKKLSEK